jgi:hypothetical protein
MMESAERSVRAGLFSINLKDVVMKWTKDTSNGKWIIVLINLYFSNLKGKCITISKSS